MPANARWPQGNVLAPCAATGVATEALPAANVLDVANGATSVEAACISCRLAFHGVIEVCVLEATVREQISPSFHSQRHDSSGHPSTVSTPVTHLEGGGRHARRRQRQAEHGCGDRAGLRGAGGERRARRKA